jgi:hypothetical protein
MRFATRYDRWLVVVLAFSAAFSCGVVPGMRLFAPARHPGPVWLSLIAWPLWLIVLGAMLPQYYEVRQDGLFIRQGWRKILLPYASLIEVQSVSSTMSAGVFSFQRLLVVSADGRRLLIAVRDEDRFLKEVAGRAPQLERRNFGLGTPFAPPSML